MNKIIYRIGEISQIFSGGDRPKVCSDVRTAECSIPIFSNGLDEDGLYGYTNKAQIEGDCITVSARGANIGVVFYRDEPFLPIVRLLSVVPNRKKIDSKYLYYYFKTDKIIGTGSAQPQITIPFFQKKKIFVYENLATQQKIANILSRYDEAIENNNKRIKLLEQMAQNLYKEWFVRFRFPGYKNCEFENGIPVGWNVEKLGNVANISTGKCNREDAEDDGIYPLFDRSQEIKLSNDWIKDCEAIIVPGEGTSFIPRYFVGKFNLHQRCYCVEPQIDKTGKFLFYTLMLNRRYFLSVATGATVPSLRYNNFAKMKFVMPELGVCQKFDDYITKYFLQIDNLKIANKNLAKQRDLLLPRLMSGKLEVK